MQKTAHIYKKLGETPLQALERFREEMMINDTANRDAWQISPMTYAGRLDPMAEGILLILIGDECKNKEKYLGLDKEYKVEIVLGISTDSYDALGIPRIGTTIATTKTDNVTKVGHVTRSDLDLSKYIGKFTQKYPPYSSKTVGGKHLHALARANVLPSDAEMPEKKVEIYSIENVSETSGRGETGGGNDVRNTSMIGAKDLLNRIISMINLVEGDFRQKEIADAWRNLLTHDSDEIFFNTMKIRVRCSSGTYMRSLADRIGGFALSIKRTRIFDLYLWAREDLNLHGLLRSLL